MCDIMPKRYSFACRDIGMNCGFKAQSDDEKRLMAQIAEHAKSVHGISSMDGALMAKVKAAIKMY